VSGLPYVYAVLRAVPRVDRGECINVAVLLYCQHADFLDVRVHVDAERLRALDPTTDREGLDEALQAVRRACSEELAATAREGGGRGAVFRWLTAPRSALLQPGPVHGGRTDDPARELDRLTERLVR